MKQNRGPETDLHTYGQLIYEKSKSTSMGKGKPFKKTVLEQEKHFEVRKQTVIHNAHHIQKLT